MKTFLQLVVFFSIFTTARAQEEMPESQPHMQRPAYPAIPSAHDISRYVTIWQRSPFVAVTDLSGQADELANRFILTGFARLGQKDFVYLFDRTSLQRLRLTTGQTQDGISLQSLTHEGNLRSVRVVLESGGRTVELGYDPAQQPDSGQPMAQPGMPFSQGQPFPQQMMPPGAQQMHGMPGQPPGLPTQGMQPGVQPGMQAIHGAQQMTNPNQIIGGQPAPSEPAPPPRRVIRRRAIVAPQ